MSYFSRLTDIVTCNLTEILTEAEDPGAAIADVISEMEEGLSGCERCVHRAERAATELRGELDAVILDARGRYLRKVSLGRAIPGVQEVEIPVQNLSSGLYFIQLVNSNTPLSIKKLIVD